MRLRRLHLRGFRNLRDVDIQFPPADASPAGLGSQPIFLLVGVNGTGKTGILRSLARIFALLEARQAPPFWFELEYELQRRDVGYRVSVTGDGSGSLGKVQFKAAPLGEALPQTNLEPADWISYLPAQTIVYTSGSVREWRAVLSEDDDARDRRSEERAEQLRRQQEAGSEPQPVAGAFDLLDLAAVQPMLTEVIRPRTAIYTDAQLELALLATLAIERDSDPESQKLAQERRNVYQRAGIDRLVGFALRLEPLATRDAGAAVFDQVEVLVRDLLGDRVEQDAELQQQLAQLRSSPPRELPDQVMQRVQSLAGAAARRLHNPDGSYHLYFEMTEATRGQLSDSQQLFGSPEQFFDFLVELQSRGVLAQVNLVLKKTDLEEPILGRHLSDGEFDFLGRMALFLLLRRRDSLFLLDEPETHFNDLWKRELVDLLSTVLEGRDSMVLLSTHSSIVISDVVNRQLILLVKDENGITKVADVQTPTFGADPSQLMIDLLNAPDSIGATATEALDELLAHEWRLDEIERLEKIIRTIGDGYYRSELRNTWRRLNALRTSSPN